jgi:trehalose/maltose transport system permease protein
MMLGKVSGFRFVAPALAVMGGIAVYPLLQVFYLSLYRRLLIFDINRFIGLENYRFLWQDDRFWNALKNTVYFTGVSVFAETLLGLGIALLLNRSFAWRNGVRTLILLPWAIPTVVSARMWEWVFNPEFGVLNFFLGTKVNWLGDPWLAMLAAVFADIWKTTPFVAILLLAGLQVIPRELYQAARVDGAGTWALFWKITLPLLKPVLLVVLIFRTLDAWRVFDVIYVLTAGGPANTTETLSLYAYKVLFQTLQFGYGSALSAVTFLFVGGITVFYLNLYRRERKD